MSKFTVIKINLALINNYRYPFEIQPYTALRYKDT